MELQKLQKLKAELEQLKSENKRLVAEITWLSDYEYGNVLTKLDDKDLINKLETQRIANINSMINEMPFMDFNDGDLSYDTVACMYDQICNMEG